MYIEYDLSNNVKYKFILNEVRIHQKKNSQTSTPSCEATTKSFIGPIEVDLHR